MLSLASTIPITTPLALPKSQSEYYAVFIIAFTTSTKLTILTMSAMYFLSVVFAISFSRIFKIDSISNVFLPRHCHKQHDNNNIIVIIIGIRRVFLCRENFGRISHFLFTIVFVFHWVFTFCRTHFVRIENSIQLLPSNYYHYVVLIILCVLNAYTYTNVIIIHLIILYLFTSHSITKSHGAINKILF